MLVFDKVGNLSLAAVSAAVAAVLLVASPAKAVMITSPGGNFDTSFEQPDYATGPLQGQNGWTRHRVRPGDIQGTQDELDQFQVGTSGGPGVAAHGSQYLQVNGVRQTRVDLDIGSHDPSVAEPFVLQFALAANSADFDSDGSGADPSTVGALYLIGEDDESLDDAPDASGEPSGFRFGVALTPDGLKAAASEGSGSSNYTPFGDVLADDTWYQFTFTWDGAGGRNLSVTSLDDGSVVADSGAEGIFISYRVGHGVNSANEPIGWLAIGGGAGSATGEGIFYVDSAIPEPGSVLLLTLGGLVGLAAVRRQR